jgi:aerobic-type carbon monoxide dehydrogenase small subunit (CoxS/CutS family)
MTSVKPAEFDYSSPTSIVTALDYLKLNPGPSEEQIRDAISAVHCRRTEYLYIVKPIRAGAEAMRRAKPAE